MTTEIRKQPGLPASDYAAHVDAVLSKPHRPKVRRWLAWGLAIVAIMAAFVL